MRLNRKIDINIGYRCNVECKFCYYKPFLRAAFLDLEIIKRQLRSARRFGIEEIDITGGEPTIYKDLIALISYARSLGFKKVCLITNGVLLSDIDFFRTIVDAGAVDFLFSIHGDDAALHDETMGRKGSFERCIKAIGNAGKLGVRYRTNSVITKLNFERLPGIGKLLRQLKPAVSSLININPCVCRDIYNKDLVPPLSVVAPYIKEAIDIVGSQIMMNAMFIPLCLMTGYERYVHNMYQIQYDPDEWDYFTRSIVQYGFINTVRFAALRGVPRLKSPDLVKGISETFHRAMIKAMCAKNNAMPSSCADCRYYEICDGPWKSYLGIYGPDEFRSAAGKRVTDPDIFMREEYP